jgi:hypothetical protein
MLTKMLGRTAATAYAYTDEPYNTFHGSTWLAVSDNHIQVSSLAYSCPSTPSSYDSSSSHPPSTVHCCYSCASLNRCTLQWHTGITDSVAGHTTWCEPHIRHLKWNWIVIPQRCVQVGFPRTREGRWWEGCAASIVPQNTTQ